MSIQTLNPTVPTTPDQGGTLAVSGINNNGHSSTITAASAFAPGGFGSASDGQSKSARWSSFQSLPPFNGTTLSKKLKFSWNASGNASGDDGGGGGTANSSCGFAIEYSLNGGSSWITHVSDSAFALAPGGGGDSFTNNGSADITLNPDQDISQIQVRAFMTTGANANGGESIGANAQADVTVSISGIRLEVDIQHVQQVIVLGL